MQSLFQLAGPLASSGDAEHWWFVAPFFWTLWLALLVTVIWVLTRRSRCHRRADRPKAILADRLARGEISVEEFRERLEALR
jgi:putative membrane protein